MRVSIHVSAHITIRIPGLMPGHLLTHMCIHRQGNLLQAGAYGQQSCCKTKGTYGLADHECEYVLAKWCRVMHMAWQVITAFDRTGQ